MRQENNNRWYGRVVAKEEWYQVIEPSNFYELAGKKSWGYRYKVRVIGRDSGNKVVLADSELSWANVVLPTTAGSGIGGYFTTPTIASGTLVTGYYEYFDAKQVLFIDGIIINSNNDVPKTQSLGEIGGYDVFNDTFGPGSKVPDFLKMIQAGQVVDVLHVISDGAVHYAPLKSRIDQYVDLYRVTPLASPCKADNTDLKGIQRVMKNLINDIESLKKFTSVSGYLDLIQDSVSKDKTLSLIFNAATDISGYTKNILERARGWIYNQISDKIKKALPFLFPSEATLLIDANHKALTGISCAFSKIIRTLKDTFSDLLTGILDRYINAPLCAAENLLTNFLDNTLEDLMADIDDVLSPLSGMFDKISGLASNIFNMMDFATGILSFFQCDDDMSCPVVHEINLAGLTNNAEGGDPSVTSQSNGPVSPSDGDTTKNTCAEQILPEGRGAGESSSPLSYNLGVKYGNV